MIHGGDGNTCFLPSQVSLDVERAFRFVGAVWALWHLLCTTEVVFKRKNANCVASERETFLNKLETKIWFTKFKTIFCWGVVPAGGAELVVWQLLPKVHKPGIDAQVIATIWL